MRPASERQESIRKFATSTPFYYFSFFIGSEYPGQFERLSAINNVLQPRLEQTNESALIIFGELFDVQAKYHLAKNDIYNALIIRRAKLFTLSYRSPSFEAHKEIIKTLNQIKYLWENYTCNDPGINARQSEACKVTITNMVNYSIFKTQLLEYVN
jgi:hypothetical protein